MERSKKEDMRERAKSASLVNIARRIKKWADEMPEGPRKIAMYAAVSAIMAALVAGCAPLLYN